MRLIVCGSASRRKPWKPGWTNRAVLEARLDEALHEAHGVLEVVEGGAEGADRMAREWAEKRNVSCVTFDADWKALGRAAGRERNRRMLAAGADATIAFTAEWPITAGTADMCRISYADGLPVTVVTDDGRSRSFADLRSDPPLFG